MSKLPKLNQGQIDLIVAHLEEMIEHADSAMASLRSIPRIRRDDFVLANIDYWRNAKGGYKHAIQQARYRLKDSNDVICPSI